MGIFAGTQRGAAVPRLWKLIPILAGCACLFIPAAHATERDFTDPCAFVQQGPLAAELCVGAGSRDADSCLLAQPPLDLPEPCLYAEIMPSFEGGALPDFRGWVCRQVEYPAEAFRRKAEGRVVCGFVVETDGTVSSVRAVHAPDSLLAAEVVRVVSSSPCWTPGRQNGMPVRVRLMLPVDFRIQEQENESVAQDSGEGKESGPKIDMMPRFKGGGIDVFREWIVSTLHYPAKALDRYASGSVLCSFVVETDGSVSSVQVLRSSDAVLSQSVVRAVSSAPRWTPGMHEGKAVRIRYNLPVEFRLDGAGRAYSSAPIDGEIRCCGMVEQESDADEVHYPEVMPRFKDCPIDAFLQWVETHIRYPAEAFRRKTAGRVVCTFVIDADGSVASVEVLESPDSVLSDEVVRLVSEASQWTPGMDDGKTVPVRFDLTVEFRIADSLQSRPMQEKRGLAFNNGADVYADQQLADLEAMPRFKDGGIDAFSRWAYSHLRYPKEAVEEGVQGYVSCRFVVDTDGSVTAVQVLQSPHPALAEEVKRLLASSPRWTPGRQKGKAVKVQFNWSVGFSLKGWEPPMEAILNVKKRSVEEKLLRPHHNIPWGWH